MGWFQNPCKVNITGTTTYIKSKWRTEQKSECQTLAENRTLPSLEVGYCCQGPRAAMRSTPSGTGQWRVPREVHFWAFDSEPQPLLPGLVQKPFLRSPWLLEYVFLVFLPHNWWGTFRRYYSENVISLFKIFHWVPITYKVRSESLSLT